MNKEKEEKDLKEKDLELTERQLLGILIYYYYRELIHKAIKETLVKLFKGEKENEKSSNPRGNHA